MKPTFLGHDATGRPLTLTEKDRATHMHVIGASGTGKSKFLEQLIREDLNNGQGFCLIDPHGSLYKEVLEYASFKVLRRDIVLLDLSKPEFVIGFNPFRRSKGDVSVQVDRRIRSTLHAWNVENSDNTPTLERVLRLIFTVLLELNLPFQDAQHFINYNAGRMRSDFISQIKSPIIRNEWQELEQLTAKEWRGETTSTKNKLMRLLTSTTLGRFFTSEVAGIDLADVIEQGKVLLVNLGMSDDLSDENARVFGSLLVNEFFEVALRRPEPLDRLKPYYLYMDEFQTFVGMDIAKMLDQVRKFKLFTVLAHQRFGQINEDLKDAVLTNCGIKAVFGGLTYESARMMALELFIGKLDPMRVKVAIYQTKFWPKYARDKVYSRSTSSGRSSGYGTTESAGTGSSTATGSFYMPQDWFGAPELAGTSTSESQSASSQSGQHSNETDFEGETEGEADVPIMLPVPFQELSGIQYMSLEEQIMQMTAALKEQFMRHCFIKIGHRDTEPLRVPLVMSRFMTKQSFDRYRQRLLEKGGAVPGEVVDEANARKHARWEGKVVEGKTVSAAKASSAPDFLGRE